MIIMAFIMMFLKDINLGKNGINNKNKSLIVFNEKILNNSPGFTIK